MKRHGNKLTALLLALCMVLGLAACGGGEKGSDANQLSGTIYVPEFIDLGIEVDYINSGCCDGKNVYIVADINTEEEVTDPETGETYTSYDSKTSIYRIPLDGSGGAAELENYKPAYEFENGDGYYYIENIRAGADGTLWLTEQANIYTYDLPDGFDEATDDKWDYQTREEKQIQRQLDSTGAELKRTETGDIQTKLNARYISSNSVMDDSGNLYVCYSSEDNLDGVGVIDGSGNVLFTLEGNVWNLVRLGNGSIATRYYDTEAQKSVIRAIDVEGKQWGDEYPLSGSANTFYDGAGEYLFYYDSGDSLYGYKEGGSGDGEKLLSWSAADINIDNVEFFSFLEDGRIAAMTRSWGRSGSKTELAVLKAADASVLANKTILSFACMYLDQQTRTDIIDFNKSSDKYRIEIRDYSEYNTSDDYQAGLTKLNTEIIAGNVPDIISTYGLPLQRYAAKGYLEDLWPLIDADPDISREGLMENVFKAAEIDGKLYQAFNSFGISTAIGSVKVVGDRMGWTLKDLQDALATMPDGCSIFGDYDTRDGMLNTLLSMNLDSYVDWETGESHFDNDQFKAVLEFCNSFPAEIDYDSLNSEEREDEPTRIANGRQMLQTMYLSGFGDIQMYEAMFGGSEALQTLTVNYGSGGSGGTYVVTSSVGMSTSDDPFSRPSQRVKPGKYISYVGYPREDGGVGSCFNVYQGLAISSTCKDKDGAWSFVRQQLLPSSEENTHGYWYFPSNKADFDKVAAEAMEKEYITDENGKNVLDENGNPVEETKSGWGWGSLNIDIVATTQEEYDQIMALYNAVDSIQSYDMSLFEIVTEQAGPYFAGDKELDETVKNIQDRVNLYINENR